MLAPVAIISEAAVCLKSCGRSPGSSAAAARAGAQHWRRQFEPRSGPPRAAVKTSPSPFTSASRDGERVKWNHAPRELDVDLTPVRAFEQRIINRGYAVDPRDQACRPTGWTGRSRVRDQVRVVHR